MSRLTVLPLLLALLVSSRAAAQEDLVEKVVVKNRLYTAKGDFEVSGMAGFLVVPQLVSTVNLNLGVGYNFAETFGVELRGGYAISGLTGLAKSVRNNLIVRDPARNQDPVVDDLSGLWQMKANVAIGLRWMPIYGKINLVADLPVHFNFYLWAGPGFVMAERESIVYCESVSGTGSSRECNQFRTETANRPMGSVAAGMRFFTHKGGAIRLEIRDNVFADSFLDNINRADAEAGRPTGTEASSPGLTHSVVADVGYTFIF